MSDTFLQFKLKAQLNFEHQSRMKQIHFHPVKEITKLNRLLTSQCQLLEKQGLIHQTTKELLNAAELELNTLKLQLGSGEERHALSSPTTPIIRGWHELTYRQIDYNRPTHRGIAYTSKRIAFPPVPQFLGRRHRKSNCFFVFFFKVNQGHKKGLIYFCSQVT